MSDDILNGMKEIAQYVKRSESTVLAMHRGQDLPMVKVKGTGVWTSTKKSIDAWLEKLLNGKSPLTDSDETVVTDSIEIAVKGNKPAIDGYLEAGYAKTGNRVADGAQFITLTLKP
jgi:hypothetical protein